MVHCYDLVHRNVFAELRSPLNAIVGCTDLMLREPKHQHDYLTTIHQCSNTMLTLVNDFLGKLSTWTEQQVIFRVFFKDYSKAGAGKIEIQRKSVVLFRLVESSIETLKYQATQKGLHLGYILSPDAPYAIVGDASHLQQILVYVTYKVETPFIVFCVGMYSNLLSNAVKFTNEGEIMITVSPSTDSSKLLFSVRDTGIGISAENISRLFQEYTQISSSDGRSLGGTGLGLAISHQL